MFVWQHLPLDTSEVKRVQKIYLENLPNNNLGFQPLEIGITEFQGMKVFKSVLVQVRANSSLHIHKDHRPYDNNQLAINIPLLNCNESVTEFYKPLIQKDEFNSILTVNGSPYISYKEDECEKIAEFWLKEPVIFRTDILHGVRNYSNSPRLAISLRFVEDPWELVSVS